LSSFLNLLLGWLMIDADFSSALFLQLLRTQRRKRI